MRPDLDGTEGSTRSEDARTEYQAAQASAEHHDNLVWTATGTLWAGSLVLLGFVITSINEGRSKLLLTAVCTLGIALTAAVWAMTFQLRDIKRQKYERCIQLERQLGYQQHSQLTYPKGRQALVLGSLMVGFFIVWVLAIGSIWCRCPR